MNEENIGFGAVEACLLKAGITCDECKYKNACIDTESQEEQDEEIEYFEEFML